MCLHQKRLCICGGSEAYLFHRDDILPEKVVVNLYCPQCRDRASWNGNTMLEDLGWLIEYDLEVAKFYLLAKGIDTPVTPEFIFDEDYCSWYGMSPQDLAENARLNRELLPLQQKDKLAYFNQIKKRRMAHFENLKQAGWRKALR